MKVMILMQDPRGGGGAEKVMAQLTCALGDRVDFVIVYADMRNPGVHQFPIQARLIEADMRWLEPSPGIRAKANKLLHRLRELRRIVRTEQPDIVLSNFTYVWHHLALILRLFRVIDVPLLLRFGNPVSADIRARGKLYTVVMRHSARIADGIIANSQGLGDDILGALAYPKRKLHVIHNPVPVSDIPRLVQEPVNEPPFDQDTPIVINVGRLVAQKNQALLLRAFQRVHAQQPACLVFIGDGIMQSELEKTAQTLGIENAVYFLGWRDNPYKYLQRASVFALSSNFEGFPSVLVEAMATGCPVIATDCTYGPAEILGDDRYGILVPPNDETAMATALNKLLTDKTAHKMYCERGMERVYDFSAEKITSQYLTLFNTLSGTPATP
jgi:glycosyltransferase involved in cell wall biosynthesis